MFGHRLQCQTSEETAHLLKEILKDIGPHPSRCHCCSSKTTRQTWYDSSLEAGLTLLDMLRIKKHTGGRHSAAAQRYTPNSTGSSTAQSNNATAQPPRTNIRDPPATQHDITLQRPNTHYQGFSGTLKSLQVLFAVQGLQWSLMLESILLPEEPCDSAFFQTLRTYHRIHRPVLLSWLSPFRFKSCRCVKAR